MNVRPSSLSQQLRDRASALAVAFVVPLFVLAINSSLSARHAESTAVRPDHDQVVAPAKAYRAIALGHREWAADILWLRALIYYGETVSGAAAQRRLQDFSRTVEEVDPRFRLAYLWGATVSVYNNRRISRQSVEFAIGHVTRGLEQFPNDGELLYQLGFLYWTEMDPFYRSDEERAAGRRRGAVYFQRASSVGFGPAWMALAAANALQAAGLNEQAIEHLRAMALTASDDTTRARIAARIEEVMGTQRESPFDAEFQRLEAQRSATFPYVQPLLFVLVGPPLPGVAPQSAPASAPSVSPGPSRPGP